MKAALRIAVVIGLLGSSGVHFYLWTIEGLGFLAPLFLLNAISGPLIAIGLLAWRHRLMTWLAVDFGVATLGSYAIAETVGVFAQRDHFSTFAEYCATGTELVCIICGTLLLILDRGARKKRSDQQPKPEYTLPILLARKTETSDGGERGF
ncbi:hypothetical protein [Amycolatopsis sp. WAC 04169]|uniref:hypothetical protein n=1 Tax=Amycolatopsis sp. WAC 04169 TaxID=2203197 RepID=UPI000F7A3DF4|nr:hypothetical protein [Amycolatopsis sp. WAC 04169]